MEIFLFERSWELVSAHPRVLNRHYECQVQKLAIFVLIKAAQGFTVRRTFCTP
jgi:hypothetical protein